MGLIGVPFLSPTTALVEFRKKLYTVLRCGITHAENYNNEIVIIIVVAACFLFLCCRDVQLVGFLISIISNHDLIKPTTRSRLVKFLV